MLDILLFESVNFPTNFKCFLKKISQEYSLPVKRLVIYTILNEHRFSELKDYHVIVYSTQCGVTLYKKLIFEIRNREYDVLIVLLCHDIDYLGEYTLPEICPNSVLLQPLNPTLFIQAIQQCYSLIHKHKSHKNEGHITIRHFGEVFNIQYDDIYFFESIGKKIAVKTRSQEIQFYSNFDDLAVRLPSYFVRCHKGFMVNTRKIYAVQLTEMTLKLSDQSQIPFSRSYKSVIKTYIGGVQNG